MAKVKAAKKPKAVEPGKGGGDEKAKKRAWETQAATMAFYRTEGRKALKSFRKLGKRSR